MHSHTRSHTHRRSVADGFVIYLLLALIVVGALRLIALDGIPAEVYGDILILFDYLVRIFAGQWPSNFVLSAGPLYQYLITPIIWLTGLSYFGLKLASVIVSMGTLLIIYALGRTLINDNFGLIVLMVAGVSSWFLVFSRLGNSQILIPLITGSTLLFAFRTYQPQGTFFDSLCCGFLAAMGLYIMPQTFILPVVMLLILLVLGWYGSGIRWGHIWVYLITVLIWSVPFIFIVLQDPFNFFGGYIGEKLPLEPQELFFIVLQNIWNGLLAFHVRGDVIFRSNPSGEPHLDIISGILFFFGVIFWLQPQRRPLGIVLIISLILLQIPSLLVRYTEQVPSASRTIGVIPVVSLLVAGGIWWWIDHLRTMRLPVRFIIGTLLLAMLLLNSYRYFLLYVPGLPNHNIAFDRVIVTHIETLPPDTTVYMIGCCWGDWSQPDPRAILYGVSSPERVHLIPADDLTCDMVHAMTRPATIIWGPVDENSAELLRVCAAPFTAELHVSVLHDYPVFWVTTIQERVP